MKNERQTTEDTRSYRVRTGLVEYLVEAVDRSTAIAAFRRRLCADLPRLWDVIHELSDDRFIVALEGDASASMPRGESESNQEAA